MFLYLVKINYAALRKYDTTDDTYYFTSIYR